MVSGTLGNFRTCLRGRSSSESVFSSFHTRARERGYPLRLVSTRYLLGLCPFLSSLCEYSHFYRLFDYMFRREVRKFLLAELFPPNVASIRA